MSLSPAILPLALTTLRLLLGPVGIGCAIAGAPRTWFAPILFAGLLSDIFDGVLARRLGVSTPALRRYDSLTDVIFYLCILVSTWLVARNPLAEHGRWIALLLASEAACIGLSLLRFSRLPATHSYAAKFYGLCLFAAFLTLLSWGGPAWIVPALAMVGLIANAEVMAILWFSTTPPVDVPTWWHLRPREQDE